MQNTERVVFVGRDCDKVIESNVILGFLFL
jgi:hypothetical protein